MGAPSPIGAVVHSLDSLGIQKSNDALSIELEDDGNNGPRRAYFNPTSRTWRLSIALDQPVRQLGRLGVTRQHDEVDYPQPMQLDSHIVLPEWTTKLPQSRFVDYFKHFDWSSTLLGPLTKWDVNLVQAVFMLFSDPGAAVLYWGPHKIAIHNDYMGNLAIDRLHMHTNFLGQTFNQAWPELVDIWDPMFDRIRQTGLAENTFNIELFPTRTFGVEETFFTGTVLPLRDHRGNVLGFYNHAAETTTETLRERRNVTLNAIAAPKETFTGPVYDHVARALSENPRDFPLVLIFSAAEDIAGGRCMLQLQSSIGVPLDHPCRHSQDLYSGKTGFTPHMRKAKAERRTIVLLKSDGSLPQDLMQGFEWTGFGEPSSAVAIIPIVAGERLTSVVVIGLNPRRPYDDEYANFINNVGRQIFTTVTSALDHEESLARETRLQTQLQNSERQIRNLAEFAPTGMCRIAPSGQIVWANDQFYEITGHEKNPEAHYELSFVEIVDEEHQSLAAGNWPLLLEKREKINVSLRLKRKWTPPAGPGNLTPTEQPAWVLALAYPVIEDDEVTSIAACITDISALKWAETLQANSAKAAQDAKKLQEEFIDVVSHEMRNPLSAIIQCADSIESCLDDFYQDSKTASFLLEALKNNVEAAKVILLCAGHQKRIIDDVLTLSKLDSLILSVTPVAVQPTQLMDSIQTMFEAECASHDIKFKNIREPSWTESNIDWVFLDPSRLTQILINLVTNAIKFTSDEPVRQISLKLGANLVKPPNMPNIKWFPVDRAKNVPDVTLQKEWGDGEQIYLSFAVQDTGKGLEEQEMLKLFNRFQQASPKTHIKYGGSGLGLFVSRQLTELQGGEIGIDSKPGKGSTFAFYIKTRRGSPPSTDTDGLKASAISNKNSKRRSFDLRNREIDPSPRTAPSDSNEDLPKKERRKEELHVLLVEDNLVNQNVLAKQLRKSGLTVYLANHGIEALDMIQKSTSWRDCRDREHALTLDAVLMDVEMPVMDGLTCTRRIRQLEADGSIIGHLTIVAITANARKEQMDHTLAAGVDSVQPKPFKVAELIARVIRLKEGDGE